MTHECMNTDGVMETVGRPQVWGIYFDDDQSPTLRARDRGFATEEDAREAMGFLLANPHSREYRVVAICQVEPIGWKICGGRKAVEPSKRPDPWTPGGVQVGKP